ncbi:MAG: aerial mycelium formation protein [Acidimicrobiia bacterium]
MEPHRRRIDQVLDPTFTEGLDGVPLDEIRMRRAMLDDLDTEFSYYRRILHGRMDLLDFELRRRAGTETRSLIEALPDILRDGASGHTSNPLDRALTVTTPPFAGEGRREVDRALADDFLARLPTLDDRELTEIRDGLGAAEREVSDQRRAVYDAHDVITAELTRRYREGVADADELLSAN